jgi:hypothetical protein
MTLAQILARIKKEKPALAQWRERKLARKIQRFIDAGQCVNCGKPGEIRIKTGTHYQLCPACWLKNARAEVFGKKSVDLPPG